jgi:hypothetical protein
MRSFFKKTKTSKTKIKRSRKTAISYGTLEDRRVLAATAAFASGVLTVSLSEANDSAIIGVANNNVTIDGNQISAGNNAGTVSANAVRQITVSGAGGAANQSVVLGGNFTDAAGRNLNNVVISNVNQVSVLGGYDVNQAFNVTLDGSGGSIGDGPAGGGGRLVVDGTTTINAGNNTIQLDNQSNDFFRFNATTTGSSNNDIVIGDANAIVFTGIQSAGDLVVDANGAISDVAGADIIVARDGRFSGTNVALGSDNQTTNFFRTSFDATGTVDLQEDSNIILLTTNAQSLRLTTPGAIFDGRTTTITVNGLAELQANNRIRLGDSGTDTFNAGSVTFASNGHVSISERSDTNVVGENRASSWTSRSIGDITNGINTSIDVTRQTGLAADNVFLGDQAGDNFETGQLFFFATDRFELEADSDLIIIERKNEAGILDLRSTGTITDDDRAFTNIRGLAQFTASAVNLGNSRNDQFNAGSIQFDTDRIFRLNEDSGTNIVNNSEAGTGSSIINSTGNITNSASATVNVEGSMAFLGDNISLGNQANDDFRFGVLTFNTATEADGVVNITEDDSTLIGGQNTATVARIQSGGAIQDGQTSTINVFGNTSFTALNNDDITIGDRGDVFAGGVDTGRDFDARFNSGSLTVNTGGDVFIEEDTTVLLTGNSRANDLTINAGLGAFNVLDSQNARTTVGGTLNVTGALINLGTGTEDVTGFETDRLVMSGLTYNSRGNTNISADSGFELRGDSRADGILILDSDGQITAGLDATFAATDGFTLFDADDEFDFVISG